MPTPKKQPAKAQAQATKKNTKKPTPATKTPPQKPGTAQPAKDPTPRRLTDMQRKFCENLNTGMTATEAAREAGYKPSYANREANQLLDKPQVRAYLDELRAASRDESVADGRERRRLLTDLMRGRVAAPFVTREGLQDGPADHAARIRAAELLAKMDGDLAPVKVDVRVTEYSREWLKQTLAVVARFVKPEELREIAREIPRFDP